jgi:hypothetical protein
VTGLRWRIADRLNRLGNQCWADLVGWAVRDRRDLKGAGLRARLPWCPIRQSCYDDARQAGRCYCGTVGSDGTVLRKGQYVCPSPMPGRTNDWCCSRPGGHDGMHRCGGIEWGT